MVYDPRVTDSFVAKNHKADMMLDIDALKSQAIQQNFKENVATLCAVYYDAVTLAEGDPAKIAAASEKFKIGLKLAEEAAASCNKLARLDA